MHIKYLDIKHMVCIKFKASVDGRNFLLEGINIFVNAIFIYLLKNRAAKGRMLH